MSIVAKVQLVRIQLQSATTCALQLQRIDVVDKATAIAELINVPVDETLGLKVGGIYNLTLAD